MSKIRRNEPCPCGSGKKYKKCCLKKDEEKQRRQPEAKAADYSETMETKRILDEMPAHLRMQAFASGDVDAEIRKYMADRALWQETIKRVENLDDRQIVEELARGKINASTSAFMRCAKKHTSAWELSEQWRKKLERPMNRSDDAFFRLAVCELWKRRLPGRPSIEMIEESMQQGYTLWMTGHLVRACDCWSETWEAIRGLLRPDMRSTDDVDKILRGTQHIHDWLQDFLLELQNAAIEVPRFADIGIALCCSILEQFPADSSDSIQGWTQDLADFYFLTDCREQGERIFEKLIRDNPDETSHYVHLAENLGAGPRGKAPIDLPRAIEIIEQAIARPVPEADAYGLQDRLRHFKKLQTN